MDRIKLNREYENKDFNYFAYVEDGLVKNVITCDSREKLQAIFAQSPQAMGAGRWIQASKKTRMPSKNLLYDEAANVFYGQQPFPSWELDKEKWEWVAPEPMPEGMNWQWDEEKKKWIDVDCPNCGWASEDV